MQQKKKVASPRVLTHMDARETCIKAHRPKHGPMYHAGLAWACYLPGHVMLVQGQNAGLRPVPTGHRLHGHLIIYTLCIGVRPHWSTRHGRGSARPTWHVTWEPPELATQTWAADGARGVGARGGDMQGQERLSG